MLKIFVYKAILFVLPLLMVLAAFIITDPFLIIYQYNDYTKTYHPVTNKDFISGETYINKRKKYHYNSFVFGSSRTLAYPIKSWQQYLNKNAVPFKFDASAETIFGIHSKIKYIDAQKDSIQNVLLIFCPEITFATITDSEGILFMKHPKISGTSNFKFCAECIKSLFHTELLLYYGSKPFTENYNYLYPDEAGAKLDTITNDLVMQLWETELRKDEKNYYEQRKGIFYQRDKQPTYHKPEITSKQMMMLKEMKQIFDRHRTNYKIIISPLYNQKEFNKTDIKILQAIFGVDAIHNYSGINDYTKKVENYYETSHYRPHVGEAIMSEIYR